MKIPAEIITYIEREWRPFQDNSYIIVEKDSEIYQFLEKWFTPYLDPNSNRFQSDDLKMDIGPYIGVSPYGVFPQEENENHVEFLFIYDKVDNSKLKQCHMQI